MKNNDPRNAHISETVTIPLRDFAVALELVQRLTCHPAQPTALADATRLLLKYRDLNAVRANRPDATCRSCRQPYMVSVARDLCRTVSPLEHCCDRCAERNPSPMMLNDYQQEMSRTYKPDRKANHALGVAGECAECAEMARTPESFDAMMTAGRIADAVKKDEYHKRPVDRAAMLKELGDVLWYTAALATDYGFTLEDVARANVVKLKARYPQGFVHGGGQR